MIKRDVKIPNVQQVYKVVQVDSEGKEFPTGLFRVRKAVKKGSKWSTHVQTFDSFDDAKRFAKSIYSPEQVRSGQRSPLFKDAFAKFLYRKQHQAKLSQATIDGYLNRAKHFTFFEPMEMGEIDSRKVDAWLNLLFDQKYLESQHSTRVNYSHEFILLGSFFKFYRDHEDNDFPNPILTKHRQLACAKAKGEEKEIRYLSAQEQAEFLAFLEYKPDIRDLALFQLHTGVRVGEAAAMEFKDLDFYEQEIRIGQHLHWERKKGGLVILVPGTKTGPTRKIPMTPVIYEMLKARKEASTCTKVFHADNQWLHYRSIQSIYDRAFEKMGLEQSGTHTLRHTFAVRFLDKTKDIYALQRILGHTDLKVTQVYAKYSNESVRRSFQLFNGGKDADVIDLVPKLISK